MTNRTRQEINAQAAAWLARLHSEERTPSDVHGFQAWLDEDVRHRDAFENLTALWDVSGEAQIEASAPRMSRRAVIAGAGAVTLAIAGGALVIGGTGPERIETALGEQRRLMLSDGSRLTLDTDTKILVSMGDERRSLELLRGRANFVVTKDPLRPFVVTAGSHEVVAVGTAFDVAREGGRVAVTMVEGKVLVRRSGTVEAGRTLIAGDRLRMGAEPANYIEDRPEIAAATAWQVGRAVFDNDRLADAIAELNRYQPRPLIIEDPSVAALRISGSYRTGDSAAFAQSIAEVLPVQVSESRKGIVIRRQPAT